MDGQTRGPTAKARRSGGCNVGVSRGTTSDHVQLQRILFTDRDDIATLDGSGAELGARRKSQPNGERNARDLPKINAGVFGMGPSPEEILRAAISHSKSASEQSATIEEASPTIEQLGLASDRIVNKAQAVSARAQESHEKSAKGSFEQLWIIGQTR